MALVKLLKSFHNDESGQGLVEYLLVVALVGLAAIVGMGSAANFINNAFVSIGAKLSNATT